MKAKIILGIVLLAAGIGGYCAYTRCASSKQVALEVLGKLEGFELNDQTNRRFHPSAHKGSVQVVNFIFTRCPGVCPMLMTQMKTVESRTRDLPNVHFISISVDPEFDTTGEMLKYGLKHNVDFSRWSLLTGPLADVERVVVGAFSQQMQKTRMPASEDGEPGMVDIMHGRRFVLVDKLGRIRAYHMASTDEELQSVEKMIRALADESL